MKNIELTLVREKEVNGKKYEAYEIAGYDVEVTRYSNGYVSIYIDGKRSGYTPAIYSVDNHEGKILGFNIQSTSYGALPVSEIKEMVKALETACEVVEVLTKAFVGNENH